MQQAEGVSPSSETNTNSGRNSSARDSAAPPPVNGAVETQRESTEEVGTLTSDDLSRCPICQFIEAGECKEAHQVRPFAAHVYELNS